MKAYGIFIFALSLAVGVTAQGATNEVAAEVTARDVQMPYLEDSEAPPQKELEQQG
ncbi:hypothetical protein ACKVWC_003526 [Pyricularia oryzae]